MERRLPSRVISRVMKVDHKPSPSKRGKRSKKIIVSGSGNSRRQQLLQEQLRALRSGQSDEVQQPNVGLSDVDILEGNHESEVVDGNEIDMDHIPDVEATEAQAVEQDVADQVQGPKKRRRTTPSPKQIQLYTRWLQLLADLHEPLMDVQSKFLTGRQPEMALMDCGTLICIRSQRKVTFLTWDGTFYSITS